MFTVSFAAAEDKDRTREDEMRETLARERARAQENAKNHANTQRLEEKYASAKEKNKDHFTAMMAANEKAANAWTDLIRKSEGATNPEVLADPKQVANAATADAYLAEMTLKYAAAATERKNTAEKPRDRDVSALVAKLDANEKALLLVTRAKNEAQADAEKLQNQNRTLNDELRAAHEKARDKDRGRDSDRDRDKDRDKERGKDRKGEDHPKNPDGGGGVLGR